MKILVSVLAIIILGAATFFLWDPGSPAENLPASTEPLAQESAAPTTEALSVMLADGVYSVRAEESAVRWAGKKPLIEGYINSGSLAVREGTVTVAGEERTGTFTIDMESLAVSETPKKPGKESMLEEHLKGEKWFAVAEYPTAVVAIDTVTPSASGMANSYDVQGTLTMKGQTNPVAFPATISVDEDGVLRAEASFEINRTEWGITAGSGSFFDDLADNVIDDMVAISFSLVADPVAEEDDTEEVMSEVEEGVDTTDVLEEVQ